MQTNDITLMDQTPEEKKSSRKAIALAGVAALGLAAALGTGFILGGRGDDRAPAGGVGGEQVAPAHQAQVSPTASVAAQVAQATDGTTAETTAGETAGAPGGTTGDAVAGGPSSGDLTPDAGSAPAAPPVIDPTPDAGGAPPPLPPCPACPPIGPGVFEPLPEGPPPLPPCGACPPGIIEPLPEDPPAPAGPLVPPVVAPCVVCPPIDPGLIMAVPPSAPAAPLLPPPPPCLVCGPILPGIIVHADATAPVISGVDFRPCIGMVSVRFDVNEHADLWVTYTEGGTARTTAHQSRTHGDFALTGGPLSPIRNIVLHAVDDAGNESTLALAAGSTICF